MSQVDLTAALLKFHPRGTWPNTRRSIYRQDEKVALIKAGFIVRDGLIGRRAAYRITPAGRDALCDVPGSGITRTPPEADR